MNYTLEEIKKHKNKINDLSNKLINISDVIEEIMINNEIKNETECLLSLLNIKKNEINNINNQGNMNFNMNNNYQEMDYQKMKLEQDKMLAQLQIQHQNMMAQHMAKRQAQLNRILNIMGNNDYQKTMINVTFRESGNISQPSAVTVQCNPEEKVSDIIEKYRNKANDHDESKKFVFNAKDLNPNLSVTEAGIMNNANIFVIGIKRNKDDENS